MALVFYTVGGVVVLGVLVAFFEHRAKRTFLLHDYSQDRRAQTESDREHMRIADTFNTPHH
jgi:hypothetical protein